MLNYEGNNARAFFLTAFHCIDVDPDNGILEQAELDALGSAIFQFQFWRTVCDGSVNNRPISFSGAVLRGAWHNSDGALLELTKRPE